MFFPNKPPVRPRNRLAATVPMSLEVKAPEAEGATTMAWAAALRRNRLGLQMRACPARQQRVQAAHSLVTLISWPKCLTSTPRICSKTHTRWDLYLHGTRASTLQSRCLEGLLSNLNFFFLSAIVLRVTCHIRPNLTSRLQIKNHFHGKDPCYLSTEVWQHTGIHCNQKRKTGEQYFDSVYVFTRLSWLSIGRSDSPAHPAEAPTTTSKATVLV